MILLTSLSTINACTVAGEFLPMSDQETLIGINSLTTPIISIVKLDTVKPLKTIHAELSRPPSKQLTTEVKSIHREASRRDFIGVFSKW